HMLAGGAILGIRMQPHESHLPFLLQFKIDFNLLGMGLLRLDRVIFRGELPARARPPAPGWEHLYDTYGVEQEEEDATAAAGEMEGGRWWYAAGAAARGDSGSGTAAAAAAAAAGLVQTPPDRRALEAAAAAAAAAATAAAVASQGVSQSTPGGGGGYGGGGGGEGGEGGSLGSSLRQELQRRVEGMLWTRHTTPAEWTWAGVVLPSRVRPPKRQTTCLLEADAVVHDIANRREAVRTRLEAASPSQQLLVSLVPMWEEERVRGGGVLPERPPSPPRTPGPLCSAVEAVRQEYRAVAEHHVQLLDERRRREEQEAGAAAAAAEGPGIVAAEGGAAAAAAATAAVAAAAGEGDEQRAAEAAGGGGGRGGGGGGGPAGGSPAEPFFRFVPTREGASPDGVIQPRHQQQPQQLQQQQQQQPQQSQPQPQQQHQALP
ncbi:hypothetical protein PLESTB_001048300, partial [Pleodorina starrii]